VSPHNCDEEIEYVREALEIADKVKMGILESIENEDELRRMWKL
jgi:hypothetical protein